MNKKISQVMTQPAFVCRTSDSLTEAAKLMWDHDCGVLPVTNEEGRVVGMITDRDICMAAYTQGRPLAAIQVSGVMSRSVYGCGPEDSLETAEQIMQNFQVRRLPVLDANGHPLGLVSLNDIARAAAHEKHNGEGLFPKQVAATLAAICAPRPAVSATTAA